MVIKELLELQQNGHNSTIAANLGQAIREVCEENDIQTFPLRRSLMNIFVAASFQQRLELHSSKWEGINTCFVQLGNSLS